MIPPTSIDGTDITGATIDGQDVDEITVDGDVVFSAFDSEPFTTITSRPNDTTSGARTDKRGLQIEMKINATAIGAEISNNTSGHSTAYLYNNDGTTEISSIDISSLSAGDAFKFTNVQLDTGEKYIIYIDNNGSSYTAGEGNNTSYPFTGTQVDIVAAAAGTTIGALFPFNVDNIGDPQGII